jgi:hypothetical protein
MGTKGILLQPAGRNVNCCKHYGNQSQVPQKTLNRPVLWPHHITLGSIPKGV